MHIIWNLVSSSIGMNWDVIQARNRTTWNLSQAAAGFRFESLDLGFQFRGIFQDIVVAPVSQGGGPATCAVSRHDTFSLSYFVFITWPLPPTSCKHSGLPFAWVPLVAIFSDYPADQRTQLLMLIATWSHGGGLSGPHWYSQPLFFSHTHSKRLIFSLRQWQKVCVPNSALYITETNGRKIGCGQVILICEQPV